MKEYCDKWKLKLVSKTKVRYFKESLRFLYGNTDIVKVNKFQHVGVIFTTCGSFVKTLDVLSGQVLKAIF